MAEEEYDDVDDQEVGDEEEEEVSFFTLKFPCLI